MPTHFLSIFLYYSSEERKPPSCFYCKQTGHMANNCPKKPDEVRSSDGNWNGNGNRNRIVCYYCKVPGHISKNCPSIPSGSYGNRDRSRNPEYGNNNNNRYKPSDTPRFQKNNKSIICFKCRQPGHFSIECTA
jgi:hypothetical protein